MTHANPVPAEGDGTLARFELDRLRVCDCPNGKKKRQECPHDPTSRLPLIELGQRGVIVRQLQECLSFVGFDPDMDGILGPETLRIVRNFQEGYAKADLSPTGLVDRRTLDALLNCVEDKGALSNNFYFGEFRSKGSGEIRVRRELPIQLEQLRRAHLESKLGDAYDEKASWLWAMPLLNGYKDPVADEGNTGLSQSRHLYGEAIDLPAAYDLNFEDLKGYGELFSGIGYYNRNGTVRHLDVRGGLVNSPDTSRSALEDERSTWTYDPTWTDDDGTLPTSVDPASLQPFVDERGRTWHRYFAGTNGSVSIDGEVDGSLLVSGNIGGNLDVAANISGDLELAGAIGGSVRIRDGVLDARGRGGTTHPMIRNDLTVADRCTIGAELSIETSIGGFVWIRGLVRGSVTMAGHCGRSFAIKRSATLQRNLWVTGGYGLTRLRRFELDGHLDPRLAPLTDEPADVDTSEVIQAAQCIAKDLLIDGTVEGQIGIDGRIGGTVWHNGHSGAMTVTGLVDGDLRLTGTISGNLHLWIDGTPVVFSTAHNFGCVRGAVWLSGHVLGDVWLTGTVGEDVIVDGTVSSAVIVEGRIPYGYVHTASRSTIAGFRSSDRAMVGEGIWLEGAIAGDLTATGTIERAFYLSGDLEGSIDLQLQDVEVSLSGRITKGGRLLVPFRSDTLADADGRLTLLRLSCDLDAPLFLGRGVLLTPCDLRYFTDYEHLRLVGSDLFDRPKGRRVLCLEDAYEGAPNYTEIADIHRRIRAVLEGHRNRAGAGDFYIGELDARLKAAWHQWKPLRHRPDSDGRWWLPGRLSGRRVRRSDLASIGETVILILYRNTSLYGLRAWLPLFLFLIASICAAIGFHAGGLDLDPGEGPGEVRLATGPEAWTFTLQSMISLVFLQTADLTVGQTILQIGCRVLGPLLLAQTILALRERVAR